MIKTSKHLTIFEGIEGSGKSTIARRYAEETDAVYQHCGPWLGDDDTSMPRRFAEAMMPAVLGHRNVVLDRSWISEAVYSQLYRSHGSRVGLVNARILERLAMRCASVVVHCHPPIGSVKAVHSTRGDQRISVEDLEKGYLAFRLECACTELPVIEYSYVSDRWEGIPEYFRTTAHGLGSNSVGNIAAKVLLVVDNYDLLPPGIRDPRQCDPTWGITAGSFSEDSWSNELTGVLDDRGIEERELLWITADDASPEVLRALSNGQRAVLALGPKAAARLRGAGIEPTDVFLSPELMKICETGFYPFVVNGIEPILHPDTD